MPTTAIGNTITGPRVLVLGGGDVGSAVAHLLFRRGVAVVIAERPRSPHARRGMAFTDALFDGRAMLDGVEACCLPDAESVVGCWLQGHALPMVTLPEGDLLAALRFDVLIDATMRRNHEPADLRLLAPLSIGIGPGYEPGRNCHVAIETQWGAMLGRVLRDAPAAPRSGGPRALDGVTRERFAIAPAAGTWKTCAVLEQQVRAGEVLGELAGHNVCAPIDGTLRGLARDGVQVMAGQRLVEVDPRREPQVRGLGERPLAIAQGVIAVLEAEAGMRGAGR